MQEEDGMLNVTELPVRKWTQDYKEFLESLIKPEDKNQKALLVDYKEFHTGANVHFQLHPVEGAVPETESAQLLAKFKLTSKITLSKIWQMLIPSVGINLKAFAFATIIQIWRRMNLLHTRPLGMVSM